MVVGSPPEFKGEPDTCRCSGGEWAGHGGNHGNLAVAYLALDLAYHRAPISARMLILARRSIQARSRISPNAHLPHRTALTPILSSLW
jgi:hypothetical protein